MTLELALTRFGHKVKLVSDGSAALTLVKDSTELFDLVITDQAMPEMTGEQLASAIKEVSPQTPIILLTGFGESRNGHATHHAIDQVLSKPVSPIDLRQALVRVLGR